MIAILALSTSASACGGFFCNNVDPVDQSGETIVFGVEDGEVTTHVRIAYTGPGEDFAWVLPVPGVPEIFLSTDQLFLSLAGATQLVPQVQWTYGDTCSYSGQESDADADVDSDADFDTGSSGGFVDVLAEAPVGPYDTAVLQATDAVALVDWLQDNGYGVPDSLTGNIAPYLAGGMNFLALKLQKDADVGELAPLGIRWAGDRPSIPLTLTAVAATPDMPLTVYVVGEHRAVPLSYLHVQLNPLVHDWLHDGTTLAPRLAQASNEAGGLAFATTYAGPTGGLRIYYEGMFVIADLPALTDPLAWFQALPSHGFFGTTEVLEVLRIYLPAPDGVDEQSFYNSAAYYGSSNYADAWTALAATFDSLAATAALEERIVEPRRQAQDLLDGGPYLTRLETAISPDEMLVDPIFGFNPDLPDVTSQLAATMHVECPSTGEIRQATRTLTLPGDIAIVLPTEAQLEWSSQTTRSWLDDQIGHAAIVVEQLSESGPGQTIADYRDELDPLETPEGAVPDPVLASEGGGGCGCSTGSSAGTLWLGVAGLWARRRQRAAVTNATIRAATSS